MQKKHLIKFNMIFKKAQKISLLNLIKELNKKTYS